MSKSTSNPTRKNPTVQDLMTAPARTVRTDESLFQAAEAMWEGDCGGVPVVSDDGKLAGIVTDRDITMCAAIQGRTLHELPVAAGMTFETAAVSAKSSLSQAHQLLRRHRVRRLPVIDAEGVVLGLLSLADLVRDAASSPGARSRVAAVRDTVAALAQPGEAPEASLADDAAAATKASKATKVQKAAKTSSSRAKPVVKKAAAKQPRAAERAAAGKAVKKAVRKKAASQSKAQPKAKSKAKPQSKAKTGGGRRGASAGR